MPSEQGRDQSGIAKATSGGWGVTSSERWEGRGGAIDRKWPPGAGVVAEVSAGPASSTSRDPAPPPALGAPADLPTRPARPTSEPLPPERRPASSRKTPSLLPFFRDKLRRLISRVGQAPEVGVFHSRPSSGPGRRCPLTTPRVSGFRFALLFTCTVHGASHPQFAVVGSHGAPESSRARPRGQTCPSL